MYQKNNKFSLMMNENNFLVLCLIFSHFEFDLYISTSFLQYLFHINMYVFLFYLFFFYKSDLCVFMQSRFPIGAQNKKIL